MNTLEPLITNMLFENGGIILEEYFIDQLAKITNVEKTKVLNSINKLINKSKLYRLENKYISLTDFGDLQEDKIDQLLSKLVYKNFLFKNPLLADGDEFCDNLIFFNGTLVIFQSKTKNYTSLNEFERFRKKCIDNAIDQLNRAINRCNNDSIPKKFKNNLGEVVEINSSKIKNIIGICVPYFHADKDYFITKENTAFLKNKTLIPNIITYQELTKIIEFNDTLPEFIDYLDKRRLLVQKNVPLLSELKILSYFFMTNRRMIPNKMTQKEFENCSTIIIDDGYEDSLKDGYLSKKLKERSEKDKNSYFIDMIVNKILPKINGTNEQFFIELLSLNRFQRRLIADNILPAYKEFIENKSAFRAPFISLDKKTGYIFVFSRKTQDFEQNQQVLTAHAMLMKTKHKLNKIIGISENHYTDGTANHNFCILEGDLTFDDSNLPNSIKKDLEDKSKVRKLEGVFEFD